MSNVLFVVTVVVGRSHGYTFWPHDATTLRQNRCGERPPSRGNLQTEVHLTLSDDVLEVLNFVIKNYYRRDVGNAFISYLTFQLIRLLVVLMFVIHIHTGTLKFLDICFGYWSRLRLWAVICRR